MNKRPIRIAAVGTAVPNFCANQAEGFAWMNERYASRLSSRSLTLLERLLAHPSIEKRHFAIDDPAELVNESRDARIRRFSKWAVDLSVAAAREALGLAELCVSDVSALLVNTCTGYICPGVSTYVHEALGLDRRVPCFDLVGAGCGGAIPNVQLAAGLLGAEPAGAVLSVAVEICSATLQMDNDSGLLLSNAIFGDGAAAAVLTRNGTGPAIVYHGSLLFPELREHIRYIYKDGDLHNQLTSSLPKRLAPEVGRLTHELLEAANLRVADIAHWVLHPGGQSVIDAVKRTLDLPEEKLHAVRSVLRDYGNMSSPTMWFVWREEMKTGLQPDSWIMALAFGAGLSVHGMLLRS